MINNLFRNQPKLRNAVKQFLFYLLTFVYINNKSKPIVLMYHSINKTENSLSISIEDFENQMVYLRNNSFNFLKVDDLSDFKKFHAENSVMITFDDGLEDVYYNAVPILKKYKIPAVFFISTGLVGNKFIREEFNCMNWEQIKEIDSNKLFEIGSHAVTHKKLNHLSIQEMKEEIFESKNLLTEKLGHQIRAFASPFGKYNDNVLTYIKDAGYEHAFSTNPGYLSEKFSNFEIPRFGIGVFISQNFSSVFKGGYDKFLKFCKILFV